MGLSHKLILWVAGFMIIGMGLMTLYSVFHGRRIIADMGLSHARRTADMAFNALYASMSAGAGRKGNKAVVKRISAVEDLREIRIIHGPPIDRQFGVEDEERPVDRFDRDALSGMETSIVERDDDGSRLARYVKPVVAVESCRRCHRVDAGEVMGAISIKIALRRYDEAVSSSTRQLLFAGSGILGATVILSILFVMRVIVRPIKEFQKAARIIGGGDLTHRIKSFQSLEINALAEEFNRMASKLGDLTKNLEKKVDERTKELRKEIAERKKSEETIRYMAYHDYLTGLPNRLLLIDRMNQILARERWHRRLAAVIFLDLDRFKNVNDTLGHQAGDEILKTVARRLTRCLRDGDTVARQGGDEFTILLQDVKRIEDVTKVIEKIFSAFEEPFRIEGREIYLTVSMGISIYPDDGEDAETLLRNADIAMYQAKEEGKNNYRFFTPAMNERILRRLDLEGRLRKAVENEEFVLHYQPEVDLKTGEIRGMEALIRWQDPERGLVSPSEFISLAEDTGLITPIGEWALRSACRCNKAWQESGLRAVSVAVNISMRQFRHKNFARRIEGILKDTGLDPRYLELELTESIVMEDAASVIGLLHELKSMDVRLTIDDFGTGYSSLEYLKRMPIDMLKIAQTFIRDVTIHSDDAAIATMIIRMGHTLGMEVIAEGVETVEQLELLKKIQCDRVQGYLISRPVPAEKAAGFLREGWRFGGGG